MAARSQRPCIAGRPSGGTRKKRRKASELRIMPQLRIRRVEILFVIAPKKRLLTA